MGEFDFTYILPENFEKRVVQYLLQLANRQWQKHFSTASMSMKMLV